MFGTRDYRNGRQVGFILTPQYIDKKHKTEVWEKDTLDAIENIGVRILNLNYQRFSDTLRIVEGKYTYSDVFKHQETLSEIEFWRSQTDYDKKLENYGFIEPLINEMIGGFIKSPNPITVNAVDPLSVNDYIEEKTNLLWDSVGEQVENLLKLKMAKEGIDPDKQDFESEEEQQEYIQGLEQFKQENTPQEIQKKMNQSWRPSYMELVEGILKEDFDRFDLEELDRKNMYEYLCTGKIMRHHRLGGDYYAPQFISVKEGFYDDKVEKIEDGDYAGFIKLGTHNEIINNFGHILSSEIKQKLSGSEGYRPRKKDDSQDSTNIGTVQDFARTQGAMLQSTPHPAFQAYENAKWIQDEIGIDLGMPELFPNNSISATLLWHENSMRTDLIRYMECYFRGKEKIGLLTIQLEEDGEIFSEIVTEDILPSMLKEYGIKQVKDIPLAEAAQDPKPNTIVWDWVDRIYYGVKISRENTQLDKDFYYVEPTELQIRGESDFTNFKLPFVGVNEDTSFVSRLEQYQRDYNINMNMIRDIYNKEVGLFYVFDITHLPQFLKEGGGEESIVKAMDIARELGLLPVEGGTQNTMSSFNQFTLVNMDMTNVALSKLQMAQNIKQLAFSQLGFTPERMGTPTQKTATANQMAEERSFNQTEIWVDKYSKFQRRATENFLEVAKFARSNGKDTTINFVDSYQNKTLLQISDPDLPARRFRIYLQNNAKSRSDLEMIKQIYLNDNTIMKDLESLAEVMSSDSVTKVLQITRIQKQLTQIEQQKEHERNMAEIEAQGKAEQEKEMIVMEWKSKENELDRRARLLEKQLIALGIDKSRNEGEGSDDIIKQTELGLKTLQTESDIRFKEMDMDEKKLERERKALIEERKLSIEDRKLEVEKYKADKELEKAKENKTQYELKAAGKLKK
jgi:hypothetical protein